MFRFTCSPDGGEPFEVDAKSRAIAAWEKAPGVKGRTLGSLTESLSMSEMVDLAWFAADRAGMTGLNIAQWCEQVDVALEDSDPPRDEAGPTPATP